VSWEGIHLNIMDPPTEQVCQFSPNHVADKTEPSTPNE
jgi:hypothetical protein